MSSTSQSGADTTSNSIIDSNTTPVSHSGTSSSTSSSTPATHNAATNPSSNGSTGGTGSSSSAPGTVDTTAGGVTHGSAGDTEGTGTGGTSGATSSGTTGNAANGGGTTPQLVISSSSSSSSIPLPTSTSTSSSSHLPTSTSSSSTSTSTTISSSSSVLPTSTSSSSIPAPTTAPTATATSSHSTIVSTSTDHLGSVVVITQTLLPTSTAIPGIPTKTAGASDMNTGPNIGAIIGGIAGGLVGVILLTWLILIPIRKRAALKKEVDWMAFGSENDHHNNDSNNDSIYRTPRAGVGEVESKVIDSPELYQMSDIGSGGHQGTLYSHLDANASVPSTLPSTWAGSGGGGANGGYNVANQVVGEMPPGQYDQNYGPAYYHPVMGLPQQQQQYGNHPSYSDHGSPETGAQRYVGQHPWPVTTTKSNQSHQQQPQHSPVNNYPFAPPLPISGGVANAAGAPITGGIQRNYSAHERSQQSQDNNSFSASTVTAYEGTGLMRSTSGQAGLPPRGPVPGLQPPSVPPAPKVSTKMDNSDDCALAYVLDETDESPTLDKGAIPGLHLANPDR